MLATTNTSVMRVYDGGEFSLRKPFHVQVKHTVVPGTPVVRRITLLSLLLLIDFIPRFLHHSPSCLFIAHMRTTMQATVSGLKRGLGYGLGAVLGGVLYSNLGPRLCFRACVALPSLSLLFLAIGSGETLGGGRRWEEENEQATEEGLEGWGERSSTPREYQQREYVSFRRMTKRTLVHV